MLDKDKAVRILQLNETGFTLKELKKQYRMNALKYHPDKNLEDPDTASMKFQEIKAAYDYLVPYCISDSDLDLEQDYEMGENESKYATILKYFMGSLQTVYHDKVNEVLHEIVEKMLSVCEKQSLQILEKIDGIKFQTIYSILMKYRHIFLLTPEFYAEMEILREKKEGKTEVVEFFPKIDDLFQHMVYKWKRKNEIYYIPLWHQELVYEDREDRTEFMVKCIPDMGSLISQYDTNIKIIESWIDEENDIHVRIQISIMVLFEMSKKKESVPIWFSREKKVSFLPEQIYILGEGEQILRWRKEGISRISSNIYDISQKSDLVVHILLLD